LNCLCHTEYEILKYLRLIPTVYTDNIRLLGMIFDTKFSWTPHLKKLKISCNAKIKIIQILSQHTWGAEKKQPNINLQSTDTIKNKLRLHYL